jgi:hypothetical protein
MYSALLPNRWHCFENFKDILPTSFAVHRGSCEHMRALENGGQRLSAEAREAQFRKMFNLDTGKRRLTCKLRLPVPDPLCQIHCGV